LFDLIRQADSYEAIVSAERLGNLSPELLNVAIGCWRGAQTRQLFARRRMGGRAGMYPASNITSLIAGVRSLRERRSAKLWRVVTILASRGRRSCEKKIIGGNCRESAARSGRETVTSCCENRPPSRR